MNIVHVVVAGEVGGAERMLVDLAGAGARDRHSVALMTPSERLRGLFHDAGLVVDDRGKVRENALSYLARSLGPLDARWLSGVLEKRSADVVHLHTFASQVLGTRAALGVKRPIVRTEHSTRVYDDPSCWPFSKWSLARVSAVVCISEHVASVVRGQAPWAAEKMRVVPNGVDTDHFAERASSESEALRFIALGRLDRRKGLDTALAALANVADAELVIVGEGEEREALTARARELGLASRVRWAGYQVDVRDEIAKADVALSSARAEGLGIALLEAMAMGKPVVALPTGGVPEIVQDGVTGWLATGSDAASLTRVMREAVSDRPETKRRGAHARDRVVDRFSVPAMRRGYEAVYDLVAKR